MSRETRTRPDRPREPSHVFLPHPLYRRILAGALIAGGGGLVLLALLNRRSVDGYLMPGIGLTVWGVVILFQHIGIVSRDTHLAPAEAAHMLQSIAMTQTLQSIPTREQLLRAQKEGGVEYVDGRIEEKPMSKESSRVAASIVYLLAHQARQTGTAEIYDSSLGYQCFPDDPTRFRKPDVSLIRRERLAGLEADPGLMSIPADLVVEVISPGDITYNLTRKVEEYLAAGFSTIWIVHPNTRTVEIHRADGSVSKLRQHDEITGESFLPGFRCKVAEFFAA